MKPSARRDRQLFFAILILATGLRLYRIADSSFWLDEFCSVECSTGRGLAHVALPRNQWLVDQSPLTTLADAPAAWHIWTSLGLDNHPPLYFLILRFWRDLFGESDLAARLLCVPISLAGICFFYDALRHAPMIPSPCTQGEGRVRVLLSRDPKDDPHPNPLPEYMEREKKAAILTSRAATALWAALLAAVAMPQIYFAQETRGYALLGTLGMAACAALARIEKSGITRPRLIALSLSVLAMLLTHYFAIAGFAALAVYAILALRGRQRRAVILALAISAAIFAIIWAPWMVQQRQSVAINNAWQAEVSGHPVTHALQQWAILPVRWCSETIAGWSMPVAIILGLAAFALALIRFRGRNRLWSLWMILPTVLVLSIDFLHTTHLLETIRYTVAGSWGLYVLLCGVGKSWRSHILPAMVTATCLVTLPGYYSNRVNALDSLRLARFLQTHVRPEDAVIFASAGRDDWYAGAMYLGVNHYAGPLPAPVMLITKTPSLQMLELLHSRRTIWLIAGSPDEPAERILPGLTPVESAVFPDIGKVWELNRKNSEPW